jgi:hypothetical protein
MGSLDFATSEPCASGAPPRMKIGLSMIFRVYRAIFKGGSIKSGHEPWNSKIYTLTMVGVFVLAEIALADTLSRPICTCGHTMSPNAPFATVLNSSI